jgi:dual specificity protein kinase YAK1
MKTMEVVAVKVVKNKPAYFNQGTMEVSILEIVFVHGIRTNGS